MKIFIIALVTTLFGTLNAQTHLACFNVPNDNFVNNPTHCGDFFFCQNGVGHPNSCPAEFYFHPITQICDFPGNVDCTECSPFGIINLPDPHSCSHFFQCMEGFRTYSSCPVGQHFSRELATCTLPELAECVPQFESCPLEETPSPVLLPSPYTCYGFYVCISGNPHFMSCSPGLMFNPITRLCDFADNVQCDLDDPGVPPPELPVEFECEGTDIYHAHPTSCSKFFMCYQGDAFQRECPQCLHFNPLIGMCDFPHNVMCPHPHDC